MLCIISATPLLQISPQSLFSLEGETFDEKFFRRAEGFKRDSNRSYYLGQHIEPITD